MVQSGIESLTVRSIAFAATCSLAVHTYDSDEPVEMGGSVSSGAVHNTILWMDRRADIEAVFINSKENSLLKYLGGAISVLMELPKVLWLKICWLVGHCWSTASSTRKSGSLPCTIQVGIGGWYVKLSHCGVNDPYFCQRYLGTLQGLGIAGVLDVRRWSGCFRSAPAAYDADSSCIESAMSLAESQKLSILNFLNKHLEQMLVDSDAPNIPYLGRYFFFYGDLLGNRSPIADPLMSGSVAGRTADKSLDSLAITSVMEFLALQIHQIISKMNNAGHAITSIFMSGSQCQNKILVDTIATACNLPVVTSRYENVAVCRGAALLAAKASSVDQNGNTEDI